MQVSNQTYVNNFTQTKQCNGWNPESGNQSSLPIPSSEEVSKVLKLDASGVPSFPPVIAKLLEICNDQKSIAQDIARLKDIARLVETDPGISTRILGTVNLSFHGLRRKISNISEAVVYLGMNEVKRICLSATVFEKMIKPGRRKNFDRFHFWRHCLFVANMSRCIAQAIGYDNSEEAYMTGLLHDYGKIIFDQQGLVNYGDFLRTADVCSGQLIDQERNILGMGHDDIGAYYSVRWGLPKSLSLVVKYHHRKFEHLHLSRDQNRLISIVALADFLSWVLEMGSSNLRIPPILQPEVMEYIPLNNMDFHMLLSNLDKEMEKTALLYNFSFPSTDQFRTNLLLTNLKLGMINAKYYFDSHPSPSPVSFEFSDRSSAADPVISHPKKILMATLQAIYNDFGFDRIFVTQIIRSTRHLKVIECLIQQGESRNLTGMRINIDQKTKGFVHSLRNNLPVLIRDNLSAEKQILNQFGAKEMVVVPFSNQNKLMGVLCMDYSISQKRITQEIFLRLSTVVNELGAALNNALTHRNAKMAPMYDPLTGLLNSVGMTVILKKYFQEARNGKMDLSVVIMDLQHIIGCEDQERKNILRLIGKMLQKFSRSYDYIAKRSDSSFLALLPNAELKNATGFAKRVQTEVEELGHLVSGRFPGISLHLKVGISCYHENIKNQEELISLAEQSCLE